MSRLASYLSFLLWLTAGVAARAQGPPSDETGSVAAVEQLSYVVITAERRAERVDQVPVAASVISGSDLQPRGVSTINDLPGQSPDLTVQTQATESWVNIRGVGLQTINPTTSSGIANYSDGFFVPHETAIADPYLDVSQVEILRGPQATLVGQSSTGGAIFVNSVRPTFDRITGFAQQTVANYDEVQTQGALNVPCSDRLAVRLAGYFHSRDSVYDDIHVGGSPQTARLHPGNADSWAGRVGVGWNPTSAVELYLKTEFVTRTGDGLIGKPYAELDGADNGADPRLSRPFVISYDAYTWDKYRLLRSSAEVDWRISDDVKFRSLTGYQRQRNDERFDNDFTYKPISVTTQQFHETTFEQELNLISTTPGRFSWIVGAFYLRDQTPTYLNLVIPPTLVIGTGPYERSHAIFGQATYEFTDRWRLLLGGRINRDEKTSTGTQRLLIPGISLPPTSLAASVKSTIPTGKVAVSYFPNTHSTIYVSASRGFKAGGVNPGSSTLIFEPEKITAYEGGYKASAFQQRVKFSATAFYYDYRNLQTTVFDPTTALEIINVPVSRSYGAELESSAQLGPIVLNSGVGHVQSWVSQHLALIDSGNPPAGPQDVTGRQLSYAPKWTANAGATYTVSLGFGRITAVAHYSYTSRAYTTLFQVAPRDLLGSHSLVSLNLELALKDGISVAAYGTNLSNSLYAAGTIGTNTAVWGPPRQYGGRLTYAF